MTFVANKVIEETLDSKDGVAFAKFPDFHDAHDFINVPAAFVREENGVVTNVRCSIKSVILKRPIMESVIKVVTVDGQLIVVTGDDLRNLVINTKFNPRFPETAAPSKEFLKAIKFIKKAFIQRADKKIQTENEHKQMQAIFAKLSDSDIAFLKAHGLNA